VARDGHVEGARFWFNLPVETPPPAPDALEDDESALSEAADRLPHVAAGEVLATLPPELSSESSTEPPTEPSPESYPKQTLKPTHE